MLIVFVGACAVEDAEPSPVSESNRAALAELGVTEVEGDGKHFVLFDDDGERIGEVSLSESTSVSEFLGDTVRTTKGAVETVTECNGSRVAFEPARAPADHDALAILEPCYDALDVASRLLGSEVSLADQGFRGLDTCIFLGSNRYCEGSTEITNHDWLCWDCTDQWVQTVDGAIQDSGYCTSWWWW